MNENEVLIIGAALTDLQLRPIPRDVFEIEVVPLERIALTIGGDAVNEATVISRLGHRTTLMSMIGNDSPGQFVLRHCAENHIDTSAFTIRDDVDTSINVGLISDEGVRNCITARQSSMWLMSMEDIQYSYFEKGYKILSFASIYTHPAIDGRPLIEIFARAKENGMLICVDMNASPDRNKDNLEDMKEALSYVDYFFPNYGEACWMTGETDPRKIADVFLSWGIKHVIVKTGAKGCLLKSREEAHELPAYTKAVCIDETGAGDNFAAGFISALLEGKNFRDCGRFATAVASIAVEHVGAATGVKTREQAEERYQDYLRLIGE